VTAVALTALAPDAAFPRRDGLLDDDALRARLACLLGEDVERCERVRATYHPGRSLRVLLDVETGEGMRCVSARMFAAGTSGSRFARARRDAVGRVLHDEELSSVFFVLPADRKLTALPRLVDGPWPSIPGAAGSTLRLFAYAPERAATATAVADDGRISAFVKLYADASVARTIGVHGVLRSRGVRVPAVLASWPKLYALAVEPLEGTRLAAREDVRGWRAFGVALARLHGHAPVDRRRFTRLEPPALEAAATTIAALRPDVAGRAFELEAALRRDAAVLRGPIVCVHGDVHPKNVVVDGEDAGLVDLDDVAGGHAAADIGSALAGLRDPECAAALLEGYGRSGPLPDPRTLRWYTAAALLGERALRSITRLRTDGLEHLDAVLAAGLEELG
jgi:hypothetical protein